MPFSLVMPARSPLQQSTVTCSLTPFLQFLTFPSKNPSTCTVVSWAEMTGYLHNGRETFSILCFLMQMYLFLCFSYLLTNHTFQSLKQPAVLSQLERGVGCSQNHHAVQSNFTFSCTNNALILFRRFLSNKIIVDNYKH